MPQITPTYQDSGYIDVWFIASFFHVVIARQDMTFGKPNLSVCNGGIGHYIQNFVMKYYWSHCIKYI